MAVAERIEQWIAALLGGEFAQTRGALRDDSGFCCLGVACEVFRRATGRGTWVNDTRIDDESGRSVPCLGFKLEESTPSIMVLPREVATWYGLDDGASIRTIATSTNPDLKRTPLPAGSDDEFDTSAASRNDAGATFPEIAAAIRREYLESHAEA